MKILILASFSESLIIFRGPLLGEMVKKGYHVTACAPDGTSKIKNILNTMGIAYKNIPLERTGLNPTKDFQTLFSLFILFQNLKRCHSILEAVLKIFKPPFSRGDKA